MPMPYPDVDHRLRALAAGRHATSVCRSQAHGGVEMLYKDADPRLRAFAGHAERFSRHAIRDLNGAVYHVTSLQGTAARSPIRFIFQLNESIFCSSM
jgi:hypothetical protein